MTIIEALHRIFESAPFERRFTSHKLRNMVSLEIKDHVCISHFRREFRAFRDMMSTTATPIYKVMEMNQWRYLKSNDPNVILKHDAHLKRDQGHKEKRKSYNRLALQTI